MHFTMSENALARKGERGSYFTRLNPKFTRQCERASGILHPCSTCWRNLVLFKSLCIATANMQLCFHFRVIILNYVKFLFKLFSMIIVNN